MLPKEFLSEGLLVIDPPEFHWFAVVLKANKAAVRQAVNDRRERHWR
jgi:hypothetical protein